MMNYLSRRPSAIAIRGVELFVRESRYNFRDCRRMFGYLGNLFTSLFIR